LIDNVLLGYEPALPLPKLFQMFVEALNDVELPAYEFCETLGSISSRIPSLLGEYLYEVGTNSRESGSPLDFQAIESKILSTVNNLPLDDQDNVMAILMPLREILNRYKDGVANRARQVLFGLLEGYFKLESLYEASTAGRVLLGLRETYKDQLEKVQDIARAASKPKTRSELIVLVLDRFANETNPAQQKQSSKVISELAQLSNTNSFKVAFRAREILIGFQTPSIEQRKNAILAIFQNVVKKSVDGSRIYFDFSQLSKTIASRYSMLDILPDLFYHEDVNTRAIALYTYIMRTNQAYTVTSFDHHFLSSSSVVLTWNYEHQNQTLFQPFNADVDPLIRTLSHPPSSNARKGIIFTCNVLDDLVDQVKTLKPLVDFPEGEEETDLQFSATVALKSGPDFETDDKAAETLNAFVETHKSFLKKHYIRRVTFMILVPNSHSRYFTFKSSRDYKEDTVIRHIEPFMSHRLEMDRLANFDIKPILFGNRGVRIYHATGKSNPSDVRFFVRGIIHPTNVTTFHDFFVSEANRITTGILDTLDLLTVSHPNTDCNHILLHFIPVFNLTTDQVSFYLDQMVRRHRARLSKLRVTEVEICYTGYHPETRQVTPFRFIISIQSQYVAEISWYIQKHYPSGADILKSLTVPPGPLDNQKVNRLHAPKQSIQPKRYKAHLLGTVYVYDFPSLFEESLKQNWKQSGSSAPSVLMECVEMVLNSSQELEPTNRAPGNLFLFSKM
jgi:acetyl-CoA carboxylase/biotin carboxylase 1